MIDCAPTSDLMATAPNDPYAAERAMVEQRMLGEAWQRFDAIEAEIEAAPQVRLPLNHIFTPGLYCREILLPKGTILTSRIHLTEHPFVISAGVVSIWSDEDGAVTLQAPHTGVTKPGTRRILFAHTDVIFSTFHVTNETDPDVIVKQISYAGGKFAELGAAKA